MHMHGCELWDLNCKYVSEFKVAWRKIKRRIWGLPYKAHNAIIHNLSYNIDLQLDTRVLKFVHSCLNHCNSVCKSLLSAKLHCIKSTFAANYKYLSYKYTICQDDWLMDKNLLIGKMKVKFENETQSRSNAHTIVKLCTIRDGIANCDIMSCTEARVILLYIITVLIKMYFIVVLSNYSSICANKEIIIKEAIGLLVTSEYVIAIL